MLWNNIELPEKNIYFKDDDVVIYCADCKDIALSGISSIVTDPPYELGFMDKSWDSQGVSFQKETWQKLRSYCLSGAPLLSFGGTRTFHRIACAIEDAGFELRDIIMWVYGQGFPKSLDISKAIDKQFGAEREIITTIKKKPSASNDCNEGWVRPWAEGKTTMDITKPNTPEAQRWNGYGTALKPAYEPIILAMNHLDKTFANNALKYGVAGLNIDECRIEFHKNEPDKRIGIKDIQKGASGNPFSSGNNDGSVSTYKSNGRFPANFIHDGSQLVMELFPDSKGWATQKHNKFNPYGGNSFNKSQTIREGEYEGYNDNGSAARFFYCAKASRNERDLGCEDLEPLNNMRVNTPKENEEEKHKTKLGNNHPTVKPLALMEYLVKLVKMPQYNLILDPFCGSGTTLLACKKLGIKCIGIDKDEKSCEIASKRWQYIN